MDVDTLYNLYSKENGFLKETLLNQTLMSGIGNIYADEILLPQIYHHLFLQRI